MIELVAGYAAAGVTYLGIGLIPARRWADHVYCRAHREAVEQYEAVVARRVEAAQAWADKYNDSHPKGTPDLAGITPPEPTDGLPSAVATFAAVDVGWLPMTLYSLARMTSRDTVRKLIPSYRDALATHRFEQNQAAIEQQERAVLAPEED